MGGDIMEQLPLLCRLLDHKYNHIDTCVRCGHWITFEEFVERYIAERRREKSKWFFLNGNQ